MKEEFMEHMKNLKEQGINVRVDEDHINDLINKISDKKDEKNTYMDSEIDKFLKDYGDISYNKNKYKFNTEEITKSLKKLHNKLINFSEFDKDYNKCMNDVKGFEDYKTEKEPVSVCQNQKEMRRYVKSLKDIVDFYNLKSGSDTSKKGEGLKILTNKQMLNRLHILLAQIQAGNNSKSLKNELRQILHSLYRLKALTKTVYNNLIKVIRAEH